MAAGGTWPPLRPPWSPSEPELGRALAQTAFGSAKGGTEAACFGFGSANRAR